MSETPRDGAFDHRGGLAALDHRGPLVMGILNTTPDSFSDGGSWGTVDRAVRQAEQMLIDGAHVIDVGGESSRPGADPVDKDEELRRVIPVIERLAGRCVMSIDTAKPEVGEAALRAGVHIVNDITASLEDVAGAYRAGWIAMHMQGKPRDMQDDPKYRNVVADIRAALELYAKRGEVAGVRRMWLDPGIGFGKTTNHNLNLLRDLKNLSNVGPDLVIGVSRKRLIGQIHALSDRTEPDVVVGVADRLEGSVLAAVWSWRAGAHIVRAHDVRATAAAARILAR
ncbi:MAG: dihydropteroate synthase [Verrucomicrobiales bacterium]|jgi:dihydropteroate synthase